MGTYSPAFIIQKMNYNLKQYFINTLCIFYAFLLYFMNILVYLTNEKL